MSKKMERPKKTVYNRLVGKQTQVNFLLSNANTCSNWGFGGERLGSRPRDPFKQNKCFVVPPSRPPLNHCSPSLLLSLIHKIQRREPRMYPLVPLPPLLKLTSISLLVLHTFLFFFKHKAFRTKKREKIKIESVILITYAFCVFGGIYFCFSFRMRIIGWRQSKICP